jgi:hypothetical protein
MELSGVRERERVRVRIEKVEKSDIDEVTRGQ